MLAVAFVDDEASELNVFEKQVELDIRRSRAACFKRLTVLKPDFVTNLGKPETALDEGLMTRVA